MNGNSIKRQDNNERHQTTGKGMQRLLDTAPDLHFLLGQGRTLAASAAAPYLRVLLWEGEAVAACGCSTRPLQGPWPGGQACGQIGVAQRQHGGRLLGSRNLRHRRVRRRAAEHRRASVLRRELSSAGLLCWLAGTAGEHGGCT